MPLTIVNIWKCTGCGADAEIVHGARYVAGHGWIIAPGESLCDECLNRRTIERIKKLNEFASIQN